MKLTAAILLLALLSAPACLGFLREAGAAPPPPADSFKVYPRPGDDGSGILVVWRSPDNQPKGAEFVVEVAAREADFATDNNIRTLKVAHSPKSLVSGMPQYFGRTTDNSLCYVCVTPADLFPPPKPEEVKSPDRLKKLAADEVITGVQLKRALSVVENANTPDNQLTSEGRACRRWFKRFQGEMQKRDEAVGNVLKRPINARTYYFRLAAVEGDAKSCVSLNGRPVVLSAAAKITPAALPGPGSFKAFDCPGDDGSAILVVWAAPDNSTRYVLQVAAREADFATDNNVRSLSVSYSPEFLASGKPQYFGRSKDNEKLYWVRVTPAALFPPPDAGDLATPERLTKLAADKVITDAHLKRALSAMENADMLDDELTPEWLADRQWLGDLQTCVMNRDDNVITDAHFKRVLFALEDASRPDNELTSQGLADRRWFEHLRSWLERKNEDDDKDRRREINTRTYCFRLAAIEGGAKKYVTRDGRPVVLTAVAEPNLFKWEKLNNLIFALIFSAIVLVFIQVARRRPNLFIRKIAGLDAVDEAIGRSTEMNRPVFFVHGGSSDVGGIATIASLNILAKVARKTAEYDSRVRVMNNDPIVTAVSQEVVQQAYAAAGRPESYNADDVPYVASDQFSYVAAVSGNMIREKPGAIFLMGSFFAESLLLAETGASTGAIQVAGTDEYTQLPFFITTCDYTLIGEELYAASAYLSRDPRQLGSLRGQDVGKAFMMVAIVVIALALTAAAVAPETSRWHADLSWLRDFFVAY